MKVAIPVKNRQEADALKRGLADPGVLAFVVVVGALMELPTDRARLRTLQFAKDHLDEHAETELANA
jgi:hypothetical protein